MGSFLEGHGDVLRGNRCLLGLRNDDGGGGGDTSITSEKMRASTLYNKYKYLTDDDDEPSFVGRLWGGCEDSHVTLESNEYYTPDGIAMIGCNGNDFYKLNDLTSKFGLEVNSTVALLPDVDTMLHWARSTVMTTTTTNHETVSPAVLGSEFTSLS